MSPLALASPDWSKALSVVGVGIASVFITLIVLLCAVSLSAYIVGQVERDREKE